MRAEMLTGRNTDGVPFPPSDGGAGHGQTAARRRRSAGWRARVDIEDRNFHWETKRNSGGKHHFATNTHEISNLNAQFQIRMARLHARARTAARDHPRRRISSAAGVDGPSAPGRTKPGGGSGRCLTVPVVRSALSESAHTASLIVTAEPDNSPGAEWKLDRIQAHESFERRLVQAGAGRSRPPREKRHAGYPWFLDEPGHVHLRARLLDRPR